jgi:hypothetical protein
MLHLPEVVPPGSQDWGAAARVQESVMPEGSSQSCASIVGVRAILTISLPAESRPDRQPKDLPNRFDCLVLYQNFPGT